MDTARTAAAVIIDGRSGGKIDRAERAPLLRRPLPVAVLAPLFAGCAFASHPLGAGAVLAAFMAAVLVVLAATDLERRIIPNRIVLPATAFVLVAQIVISPDQSFGFMLAAIVAGIFFLIPNLISPSLMGMGDVKLVVMLGAGLGAAVMGAITIAFISVFPVALAMMIRGGLAARKTSLPFGPFLAFGGLVVLIVPHLVGLS
jgi:leader peptidase (prepilin peptidase) / N-methyltransferase